MAGDRFLGDRQLLGDRRVGEPLGHQGEHFALSRGQGRQRADRVCSARDGRGRKLGVERGPSRSDPAYIGREPVGIRDAVLEEVADPAGSRREQLARIRTAGVLREDEHTPSPTGFARSRAPPGARRRAAGRHPDVGDHHVGPVRARRLNQMVGARDRGDHLGAAAGEYRPDTFEEQRLVIGDHDAHGTFARTIVPPPGGLSTANSPPSAVTRSRRLPRPTPDPIAAPPGPSSAMSMANDAPLRPRLTRRCDGLACRSAFVSASATTK